MKNGKYENKAVPARKSASVRSLALLLALVLLLGGVIGGTIAWLTAKTTEVTNTFTTSDISITLAESDNLDLKMIPGWTITKDPYVTVTETSEDCYLFVKIDENLGAWSDNQLGTPAKAPVFKDYLLYAVAAGWTPLDGVSGVYYKVIDEDAERILEGEPVKHYVLEGNKVTVSETVTKEMMAEITNDEQKPTLTFTAYAVQLYKDNATPFTPAEAWANAPKG